MKDTRFKKGQTPWNKGIAHTQILRDKHPNWKGGKPSCEDCGRGLGTYASQRCIDCHLKSDKAKEHLSMVGFKKGDTSPRKSLIMSDEQKLLVSQNRRGKNIGKDNPRWKGGITPINQAERTRFRQYLQAKVFNRDNYTCQICEQYGGSLQVDHIKSWKEYPELRFDVNNCRTLCMACHYYITFKRKLPQGVVWGHNLSRRMV